MPLQELARHGHEVKLVEQGEEDEHGKRVQDHLRDAGQYDIIVGERFAGYDGISGWRDARRSGARLVYENDDDLFNITQENWVAYQRYGKVEVREAVQAYSEAADLVTVTTEPLAEVFRAFNPAVAVLPNCVPECAFRDDAPGVTAIKGRRPRVGWIGGSSHGRDIHLAAPAVRRFVRRFPGWDFYLGGTDFRASFKVPDGRAVHEPWRHVMDDDARYYRTLDNFEIGLAPLLDTKFARAKSALKCAEYGARGIPVIASDARPYADYLEHGVNGFLARTDHEWLSYMSLLASDDELRLRMGASARDRAREFAISDQWVAWEAAYQGLLSGVVG